MREVTIIHTADLHLGMQPEKGLPIGKERAREVGETLARIVDACNEADADLLLIAGDLFHRGPLVRELKDVAYLFSRLRRARVVFIAGNHDYISARSNYPAFVESRGWRPEDAAEGSRVTMLTGAEPQSVALNDIGVTVCGMSYPSQNVTDPVYDALRPEQFAPEQEGESAEKPFYVLLAHGGDAKDAPLDIRRIAGNGWDYVALGHIHKPDQPAPGVVFAGSPEPLDRNETGAHGYWIVRLREDDDGARETGAEFVPCSVREYRDLPVEVTAETTDAALRDIVREAIEQSGAQHMYRIFLEGRRDASYVPDAEALQRIGNVTEVVDRTMPEFDLQALRAENADNLIGMFIESLAAESETDEVARKALGYGLAALLPK